MPDTINTVVVLDLKGKLDLTEPPLILSGFDSFVDTLHVQLKSDRENIQIHYATDQSSPGLNSPLYSRPCCFRKTTTIAARCYRDGKPVSGVSTRMYRKVETIPGVNVINPVPGIKYCYYEGNWDSIPDFTT